MRSLASSVVAIAIAAVALGGCESNWPRYGSGGVAEFAGGDRAQLAEMRWLTRRLDCSRARLDAISRAAEGRRTGEIALASDLFARAQREATGGLSRDAMMTLIQLNERLIHLRGAVGDVPEPAGCAA